jgi:hypothetical protein
MTGAPRGVERATSPPLIEKEGPGAVAWTPNFSGKRRAPPPPREIPLSYERNELNEQRGR